MSIRYLTRTHTHTHTLHRTAQNKQYIEQHNNFGRVCAVPRPCGMRPRIIFGTDSVVIYPTKKVKLMKILYRNTGIIRNVMCRDSSMFV